MACVPLARTKKDRLHILDHFENPLVFTNRQREWHIKKLLAWRLCRCAPQGMKEAARPLHLAASFRFLSFSRLPLFQLPYAPTKGRPLK